MKDRKIAALPVEPRGRMEQELINSARSACDNTRGTLSGYVVIAWNENSYPVIGWRTEQGTVPMHVLPAFIAEAMHLELSAYLLFPDPEDIDDPS